VLERNCGRVDRDFVFFTLCFIESEVLLVPDM
jgi:hypothetical protein